MIVAFSGLDGAGKSTQIAGLEKTLDEMRKHYVTLWARGGYTPGMEMMKRLLRKSKVTVITKPGPSMERDNQFKNPVIRKLWLTLAILDLIFYYSIISRIKGLLGNVIIFDRYLVDTKMDFQLNFPSEKVSSWFLWRILKETAPRPDFHFVLIVSVTESQRRSKLKNEPFPDPATVLQSRLEQYQIYCKNNADCYRINCERPIDEVEQEIKDIIRL